MVGRPECFARTSPPLALSLLTRTCREGAQWEAASDKYDLERIYRALPRCPRASPQAHRRALARLGLRGLVDGCDGCARSGKSALTSPTSWACPGRRSRARVRGQRLNGAQAREIGAYADGIIVGSALVKTLFDGTSTVA